MILIVYKMIQSNLSIPLNPDWYKCTNVECFILLTYIPCYYIFSAAELITECTIYPKVSPTPNTTMIIQFWMMTWQPRTYECETQSLWLQPENA